MNATSIAKTDARRKRVTVNACFLLFAIIALPLERPSCAQDKPPVDAPQSVSEGTTSNEESDPLTDGLLDLVSPPTQSSNNQRDEPLPERAGPVGAERAFDATQDNDPARVLQLTRMDMQRVAQRLGSGQMDAATQTLQSNIIRSLDEIINSLAGNQQSSDSPSQSQSQPESSSPPDNETPGTTPQSTNQDENSAAAQRPGTSDDAPESPSSDGPPGSAPGQFAGSTGDAQVDLAAQLALKQQVWGQLPARIREQMNSRMVERFLPAYEEQIEAYFRALLDEKNLD